MIWITTFNANPNSANSNVHEIFMRNMANWLNARSYIERYSYFFPNVFAHHRCTKLYAKIHNYRLEEHCFDPGIHVEHYSKLTSAVGI
jgi:hypothetical protein